MTTQYKQTPKYFQSAADLWARREERVLDDSKAAAGVERNSCDWGQEMQRGVALAHLEVAGRSCLLEERVHL